MTVFLRKLIVSCAFLLMTGLLFTCDNPAGPNNPFRGNPFTNNLGEKVDVEQPQIKLETPGSGAYLKGKVTFRGWAKAYRELSSVEIRIYTSDRSQPPLLNWSKDKFSLVGDIKEKNFTYELDTLSTIFGPEGLPDGEVMIQFRARDPSQYADTVELVYIVKNKPSVVRMSAPGAEALSKNEAKLEVGTEIRGQIIDRRGIKPGYPMIKIWPAGKPEPPGDQIPNFDDPNPDNWIWGGWGRLYLSNATNVSGSLEADYVPLLDPGWTYADRSNMQVAQAGNFIFKLAKYDIDPATRKITYKNTGGVFENLPILNGYNFRIMVSETYFYSESDKYLYPREPLPGEEPEITGFYPPGGSWDNVAGDPYFVQLVSTGVRPDIEIDNNDVSSTPGWDDEPNIYITDENMNGARKIWLNGQDVFRLRVHVTHESDGVSPSDVELTYKHPATGAKGDLTWTTVSGTGAAGTDDPLIPVTPGTLSPYGLYFEYTAQGSADRTDPSKPFTKSSMPYTLTVTAQTSGGTSRTANYTVYVNNEPPNVEVRSVKGAAKEEINASGVTVYTVNGNIEVTVDYSAAMGINTKDDEPLVKWIVVKDSLDDIDTKINAYNTNPHTTSHPTFFEVIDVIAAGDEATAGEGWILSDDNRTFKFNTGNYSDGDILHLYVIAQDSVQLLGYKMVILKVDKSTDYPVVSYIPGMTAVGEVAGANAVDDPKDLFIELDSTNKLPVSGAPNRRNILDKDTSLLLTLTDDDGIKSDDIKIKLTDLNNTDPDPTKNSVTISPTVINQILSARNENKEWTGTLQQSDLGSLDDTASPMYNNGNKYLKDGIYKLEISCRDDNAAKVSIPGVTLIQQDSVDGGNKYPMTIYFCVINDEPEITIDEPQENSYVTSNAVEIKGKIKSRIPMQRMWISFKPALNYTFGPVDIYTAYNSSTNTYSNQITNSNWNNLSVQTPDPQGYYIYYWHVTGVDFNNTTLPSPPSDERQFTLEAADNIGNITGQSCSVRVDNKPPDVELDEFFFGRPLETGQLMPLVNGKFNFIINAWDLNGIKKTNSSGLVDDDDTQNTNAHVKWWILYNTDNTLAGLTSPTTTWATIPAISPTPLYQYTGQFDARPQPTGDDAGGGHYSAVVVSGYIKTDGTYQENIPDGKYKLWAAAEDKAGNITVKDLIEFEIKQEADYPKVVESELSPPSGANTLRRKDDAKISGRITDDDGFVKNVPSDSVSVQIQFKSISGGSAWTNWIDVKFSVEPGGGALDFVFDHETLGSSSLDPDIQSIIEYFDADGEKEYRIKVTDQDTDNISQDGKNPVLPPNITGLAHIDAVIKIFPNGASGTGYTFRIKNTNPEVFFANNDEDGGNPSASPVVPPHPNYSADRPVYKIVSAADITGFVDDLTFNANLTNNYSYVSDPYLAYVDISYDRKTPVVLYDATVTPVISEGTYSASEFKWNLSGVYSTLLTGITDTNDDDRPHTITVTARDLAGNSASVDWTFNKDNSGPRISFNNYTEYPPASPLPPPLPPYAASALPVLSGDNLSVSGITGRLDDEWSSVTEMEWSFYTPDGALVYSGKIDAGSTNSINTFPFIGDKKIEPFDIPIPFAVPDGKIYFTITAKDERNNITTTQNLWLVIDSKNPVVVDTQNMIVGGVKGYDNTGPSPNNPRPITEEKERIFSANGLANTAPVFTLSGTVDDANLRTITIYLRSGSYTSTPLLLTDYNVSATLPEWDDASGTIDYTDNDSRLQIVKGSTPGVWEWTLTVFGKEVNLLKTQLGTSSGPCFISVGATDLAGRNSDPQHWRFSLDTGSPDVNTNFTTIGKQVFENAGDITISGTADDDNMVRKIDYYLEKYDYSDGKWKWWNSGSMVDLDLPSPPPPTWSEITANPGSTVSWALSGATLDAAVYGTTSTWSIFDPSNTKREGRYRLNLIVSDWSLSANKDGNTKKYEGYSDDGVDNDGKEFFVDRGDTKIEWTGAAANSTFVRNKSDGSIEIALRATDINSIKSVSVTLKGPPPANQTKKYDIPLNLEINTNGDAVNGYWADIPLKLNIDSNNGTAPWDSGTYKVEVTVKDFADKETFTSRDINVDNNKPVIRVNNSRMPAATPLPPPSEPPVVDYPEALSGREKLNGSFTKEKDDGSQITSGSPIAFVAFYVAPNADGVSNPPPEWTNLNNSDYDFDLSNPAVLNALSGTDPAKGWRFYHNVDTYSKLMNGVSTLMKIDEGKNSVNFSIPGSGNFLIDGSPYKTSPVAANTLSPLVIKYYGDILTTAMVHPLQIYFMAMDEAGNRTIRIYNYYIYPEGDRPTVTVTSPGETEPEAQRLLNGVIRLGGSAKDNVRVQGVWFRILDENGAVIDGIKVDEWDTSVDPWVPKKAGDNSVYQDYRTDLAGYQGKTINGTGGWFRANGGGRTEIQWWARVNYDGELDPGLINGVQAASRKITIEVLAEDFQYSEDGVLLNGNNPPPLDKPAPGLLSDPPKKVGATVVKGVPEFKDVLIRRSASLKPGETAIDFKDGTWLTDANLRGRAAYSVTVSHDSGLKELNWTPADEPINLLDRDNDYNKTIYAADLAALGTSGGTYNGIAVKAGPKNELVTGNWTLKANTKYLIWTWDRVTATDTNFKTLIHLGEFSNTTDMRFVTFTPEYNTPVSLGNNELMEANAAGQFEWVVVIDVHADYIKDRYYEYGNPVNTKGDYSGIVEVSLRAVDNAKTMGLYSDFKARLPIDQNPPAGAYTHNSYVAGSSAMFGGAAGDPGEVSGLDRVVLWFSRKEGGVEKSISWRENEPGNTFEGGGTIPDGVTLPTGVTMPKDYPEGSKSGNTSSIVLKYNDPLGYNSQFGNEKLQIGWAQVGGELGVNWYVTLDSTKIKSGKITAHFIVYDKAGNAKYYSQTLVVMNNVPRITSVTLATDIRGDNNLLTDFTGNKNWGADINASPLPDSTFRVLNSPIDTIKDKTYYNLTTAAAKGVSAPINIDTKIANTREYGMVYDEAFNVRNKLLAVQVNVAEQLDNMGRTFRVEYVSGAKLLSDTNDGNSFYKDIRSGRIYIINEPGVKDGFPWGSFGVQGVPKKGLAFMAVKDGADVGTEAQVPKGTYGSPSVWELNSSYYTTNNPDSSDPMKTLVRGNVPTDLRLGDVKYNPVTGKEDAAQSAAFVYAGSAFDALQFNESGASPYTYIHDFTPTISKNVENYNRPAPYPAFTGALTGAAAATPWEAHSLFIVRVFGGTEDELFGDFALLSIRVNNNDRTKPYAQLYDINPKTENTDREQALGVPDIGGNRTKGGLYNAGTAQKSGHIEPRRTDNGAGANPRYTHTLTSAEMGGASNANNANIKKPYADPANFFTVDTVSGGVILRGYAEDDQRIAGVRLTFGTGAANTVDILEPGADGANKLFKATTAANGRVGWYDTVDIYRHRVEWAYLWDTEEHPDGIIVGDDITVDVIAYNADAANAIKTGDPSDSITYAQAASGVNNPQTNPQRPYNVTYDIYNPGFDTGWPRYNQMKFNLRPYITGFLRNQDSHNTRSRQGRYIFARGETAVVTGFNLLKGTDAAVINLPGMGNDNTINVTAIGDFGIETANNTRYRLFTVGNGATSTAAANNGVVTLTVSGVAAVNTSAERVATYGTGPTLYGTPTPGTAATPGTPARPRAILPWNIEATSAYGTELWDDFTQVHIWQSNDATGDNGGRFASRDSAVILNPAMSIDPINGRLYESHNSSGGDGTQNSQDWFNTGRTIKSAITDTTVPNPITQFADPIFFSDVYRSPGGTGNAADTWAVSAIIGRSSNYNYYRALGGVFVSGPGGGKIRFHSGGTNANDAGNPSVQGWERNEFLYSVESTWYNASAWNQAVGTPGTSTAGGIKNPATTDQFMNPHVVTSYSTFEGNNREHIHVSYYDDDTKSLKYRYNLRGSPGRVDAAGILQADGTPSVNSDNSWGPDNNTDQATKDGHRDLVNSIPRMWTNLDGGYDLEDTNLTNYIDDDNNAGNGSLIARLAGSPTGSTNTTLAAGDRLKGTAASRAANAGKHNSITVNSDGFPVIAYYAGQDLKIAISNRVAPIRAESWFIQTILAGAGTGEFVSMKIDTIAGDNQNRVHIAAMNTDKRLVYITGKLSGTTLTDIKTQVVDSVGNVGRWCALSLDEFGNPWISYMDESYLGSRDGVKVAYLNTTIFYKGTAGYFSGEYIDRNGTSIAGWETMHVPTQFRVNNPTEGPGREHGRLGMECIPARNKNTGYTGSTRFWNAAVSYFSQDSSGLSGGGTGTGFMDRYRVAYYVK
jgi:hypothetical protein